MEDKKDGNFELPNEKIVVKYIHRNSGMSANVSKDHVISGGMLSTSTKRFAAPLQRNNTIKNILTSDEKEYLEKVTDLNLSIYGDFWKDFYVTLYKEDSMNVFNTSDPMDYISIKILESLSKHDIAPSWKDRNKNLTYQFAITRLNEEILESQTKLSAKREAFISYTKMMNDRESLKGILKLLTNRPISPNSELDWLQNEVEKILDVEPIKFLNVIKDSELATKLLVNEAVDCKIIVKKGGKYKTADGLELCGAGDIATFENTVAFLQDPLNQDTRAIIEAKIAKTK